MSLKRAEENLRRDASWAHRADIVDVEYELALSVDDAAALLAELARLRKIEAAGRDYIEWSQGDGREDAYDRLVAALEAEK